MTTRKPAPSRYEIEETDYGFIATTVVDIDQPALQALIDWDAAVVYEDRDILEATDPDAALDLAHRTEAHMTSDRPGLIMRRRLLELLKSNNDLEATQNYVVAGV